MYSHVLIWPTTFFIPCLVHYPHTLNAFSFTIYTMILQKFLGARKVGSVDGLSQPSLIGGVSIVIIYFGRCPISRSPRSQHKRSQGHTLLYEMLDLPLAFLSRFMFLPESHRGNLESPSPNRHTHICQTLYKSHAREFGSWCLHNFRFELQRWFIFRFTYTWLFITSQNWISVSYVYW